MKRQQGRAIGRLGFHGHIYRHPQTPAPDPRPGFVARPAAGSIARLYEELGGAVTYIGKPNAPIYEECLRLLGRPDPSRVLAIGDSLDHDVRGGAGMGMGTVLITSGILGPEFAASTNEAAMVETALRLASETGDRPDWLLPSLVW